jgi:hypothetical protein
MKHKALNQLLCAAVINQTFRQALLQNPVQALDNGYHGQSFAVSSEERALLSKTRATTLEELAAEVYAWISGNGYHGRDAHEAPSRPRRVGQRLGNNQPREKLVGVPAGQLVRERREQVFA